MIPPDDDSLTPPPRRRWWQLATVDFTPLRRHRDFRLLFISRFVSFFGSMVSSVAFPSQVYQLAHSVLLVGVLGVLEFAAKNETNRLMKRSRKSRWRRSG